MLTVMNLGGTIALAYDEAGRHVTLSGPELLGVEDTTFIEIDPVQSNALTWNHLVTLRQRLLDVLAEGGREALVITGTGTAEDVATFLDVAGPPGIRVALLVSFEGATVGTKAPGIDAAHVWLCSDDPTPLRLFADGVPFRYPFEKRAVEDSWEFFAKEGGTGVPGWRVPATASLAGTMPLVPVASVGIDAADWIGRLLRQTDSEGIVLEAYGAGDVPPAVSDLVTDYLVEGGHVVVTSLARPGRIEPTYPGIPGTSHGLLSAGCYGGGALTARQARMRLAVALASGIRDAPRRAFARFSEPSTS